jgi:hypothetical protein
VYVFGVEVIQHAKRMRLVLLSLASLAPRYSSTLSHKSLDFFKKKLFDIKFMFLLSAQVLLETFRRTRRDIVKNVKPSPYKVTVILVKF